MGKKMSQLGTKASQVRVTDVTRWVDVYAATKRASSDCCPRTPTTRVSGLQHPLVTAYTDKLVRNRVALKQVELVDGPT